MNGLLLIITRPPSTIMHCIPCVRSFAHLLVIKINFSAKQSTKIRLFKIKNLKFWRRRIEGPLPIPHTVRVPRFDLLTSCGARPPSCFWTIRALVWSGVLYALTLSLQRFDALTFSDRKVMTPCNISKKGGVARVTWPLADTRTLWVNGCLIVRAVNKILMCVRWPSHGYSSKMELIDCVHTAKRIYM